MDIKILDSWLRDYLNTKATAKQIARYLTLCGPSVEKTQKVGEDAVYSIEVTTNRVDCASEMGIAREAAAILPIYDIAAKYTPNKSVGNYKYSDKVGYLIASIDFSLCQRFSAVLVKNVKVGQSPKIIRDRLQKTGYRSINNVVDISNYLMHEMGQPVHTFDYDKIKDHKMILRKSKRGEKITTLDGSSFTLKGNDIVIEDGTGKLIDLCGIMGGESSAITKDTTNVLVFIQRYNPINIRKTSMSLAQRTEASFLFEKGIDPELVGPSMQRAIKIFKKITGGSVSDTILDIYPNPKRKKSVTVEYSMINSLLGKQIDKKSVLKILEGLNFKTSIKDNLLLVTPPSYRSDDINIPQDVVEEIARIYGYSNLDSRLMAGDLPDKLPNSPFEFELILKQYFKGVGGYEIYSNSLVSNQEVISNALSLTNPLGEDQKYLRTSLMPSLLSAAKANTSYKDKFLLFEMANIYIPIRDNLPNEKVFLAGIFVDFDYRNAKGIIEAFLNSLHLDYEFVAQDFADYSPNKHLLIKAKDQDIGHFGYVNKNMIYWEFETTLLQKYHRDYLAYKTPAKYPAQIEDLSLILPRRTKIGEVIKTIYSSSGKIADVQLNAIYKDVYTLRIHYQDSKKTLTDSEVEQIRKRLLARIKSKYSVVLKP